MCHYARTSIVKGIVKGSKVVPPLILLMHFFSHFSGSRVEGGREHPVHLGLTASGEETKPHHLPWTDPDCSGKGQGSRRLAAHR